jgi:hypothetical protein
MRATWPLTSRNWPRPPPTSSASASSRPAVTFKTRIKGIKGQVSCPQNWGIKDLSLGALPLCPRRKSIWTSVASSFSNPPDKLEAHPPKNRRQKESCQSGLGNYTRTQQNPPLNLPNQPIAGANWGLFLPKPHPPKRRNTSFHSHFPALRSSSVIDFGRETRKSQIGKMLAVSLPKP